jgi:hypothetical protein
MIRKRTVKRYFFISPPFQSTRMTKVPQPAASVKHLLQMAIAFHEIILHHQQSTHITYSCIAGQRQGRRAGLAFNEHCNSVVTQVTKEV